MSKNIFSDLSGKTLVATPYMLKSGIFHKSLIYILSHTVEGAVGLIFNHLINHVGIKSFFKLTDDNVAENLTIPIYFGGPVEHDRGFFLHSTDYQQNILLELKEDLAVSSNTKISLDIAKGYGPKNSLFIIGYTSWKTEELEEEIKNNLWIVTNTNKDFIFADHCENKWTTALRALGINELHFASQSGHA